MKEKAFNIADIMKRTIFLYFHYCLLVQANSITVNGNSGLSTLCHSIIDCEKQKGLIIIQLVHSFEV